MHRLSFQVSWLILNEKPKLTIGYSVLADRAKDIQLPELTLDHEVLIFIQNPAKISFTYPKAAQVRSVELSSIGVAKSRNEVLHNASTEFLLFGDDDVIFLEDGIRQALHFLEMNPRCDMVLSSAIDNEGKLRKKYPIKVRPLTHFNSAKAATYEMIVRVKSFKDRGVLFDENFGAGAQNYLGDEYIFITDLLKRGGEGVFLPMPIAIHPQDSSGSIWGTQRDLIARARIFTRVFGIWAPLIRAAFFLKSADKSVGVKGFLRFIRG